ncbi:hydroxyisourate hydrolase [Agromyces sp. LHK192]|uniref:hydroxyisourate hydrolase n=1 Tax=Agromyces sp. LHK192 TaxID=2498704 RepID=UPI000FD9EBCA|nr:hydroxyisourate hydrolase [Agromyces sp. LHK192]
MSRSHITTHVLDATKGLPAAGIGVELSQRDGDDWTRLAQGVTDADGRITDLGPESVPAGEYRLRFETGAWFQAQDVAAFHPEIQLAFVVDDEARHYHVPILLSPFAYSTYRGS